MSRRADPKARSQLNEAAATGRRRAQVQEQSSRQRDAALRSRRLLAELSGAGGGADVSEAALTALGPDVLADRVRVVAGTLSRWAEVPTGEWQAALQQLATLLSTGCYQPAEAALASGAVPSLGSLLQLSPQQLPRDAARRAAWALELLANSSPAAAGEVLAAAPALLTRMSAAVAAVGAAGREPEGVVVCQDALLEADQLAAVFGAMAAWNPELQGKVVSSGAAAPVLQLLLGILEPAAEAASAAARELGSLQEQGHGQDRPQQQPPAAGEEPPVVRCCATALWAVGMLVRGRTEEILQLVSQAALPAGLRRVLQAPPRYPVLLREAAWLLAFCTATGGPEAVTVLVDVGGLLPGLLLALIRCVHKASLLGGDDQASHEAAQPLHQALIPLLMALANIAAEPSQTLLALAELQASRPLPPSPLPAPEAPRSAPDDDPMASSATADIAPGTPEPSDAVGGAGSPGYASGMQALAACLASRVSHRGVVRGAAAVFAGLASGACRAGAVAVDSVRAALRDAGVVAALVGLLCGAALDIRKEAAAALTSLCQGADAGAGGGAAAGEGGSGPGPGTLDMLRSLGVHAGRDECGVVAAFLGLLRSPDADAVHMGLRFVTLVLGGVRRGPQLVEGLDGIDALEAVQYGTSGCRVPELQKWAEELVDQHYGESYGEEEDDEDEDGDNM